MFWFPGQSEYHNNPFKIVRGKRGRKDIFLIFFFIPVLFTSLSMDIAQSTNQEDSVNIDSIYWQAYDLLLRDNQDDNQLALKGFEQAASGYEELENWTRFSDCMVKQAIIQIRLRNFDQAERILGIAEGLLVKHIEEEDSLYSDFYFAKGSYLYGLKSYEEAIELLTKAGQIREKLKITDNILSYIYNNLGGSYYYLSDYAKALEGFKQSIDLKERLFVSDDPKLASSYINYGSICQRLGRYGEAINFISKGTRLYEMHYGPDYVNLGGAYNNLGLIYDQQADFQKALDYYHSALRIYEKQGAAHSIDIAKIHNNIGLIQLKLDRYEEALEWLFSSLETKIRIGSTELSSTYNNIGETYRKMGDHDKASEYFLNAIDYTVQFKGEQNIDLARYYLNYGLYTLEIFQDYEKGMNLYRKALDLCLHFFGTKHPLTAKTYYNIGNYYFRLDDLDSALFYVQKSIISLVDDFHNEDYRENPAIESASSSVELLNYLKEKAFFAEKLFAARGELSDLQLSFSTLELANTLIEEIRSGFQTEESRMIITQNEFATFRLIIHQSLNLFQLTGDPLYKERAFEYSEKSKSANLLAAIRNIEARELGGIPGDLIEEELELQKDLNLYKEMVYEEREKEKPREEFLKTWEGYIFSIQKRIDSLIHYFETHYPDYYALKFNTAVTTHKDIADFLKPNEVILEYTISDSLLISFLHSKEHFIVHQDPIDSLFHLNTRFIREILTNRNFSDGVKMDYTQFTHASHGLYKKLIGPFEEMVEGHKLIIVPDETLAYIPFEILVSRLENSQEPNYQGLPYLLKDHSISYSNSATLLVTRERRKKVSDLRLLAFAPYYRGDTASTMSLNAKRQYRENLYPIPGASDEVAFIHELVGGDMALDDQATESYFKRNAPFYDMLHLAMHTVIDDVNPMYSKLVFSDSSPEEEDGLLNTFEIYGLTLSARMVVLSSCSTGAGKMQKGEGVMSLARGFIYAGCPSIIMTLWEVEDNSGVTIMKEFYTFLKKGYAKDEALRQAKLNFLTKATMESSHPYFWSGYVNIGDSRPVFNHPANILAGLLMLFLVLLLAGIYLYKKKLG